VAKLRILKTITFAYEPREDRILTAINAGRSESWSCWITRRQVLTLLEHSVEFVAKTSPVMPRVAAALRPEVAAIEREAAIVKTAPSMSHTPPEIVRSAVPAAELVQRLTFIQKGDSIVMEVRGSDDGAEGVLTRAEFQRILQMLQIESAKGQWLMPPATAASTPSGDATPAPKPFRH
jgi:hypothetical protein